MQNESTLLSLDCSAWSVKFSNTIHFTTTPISLRDGVYEPEGADSTTKTPPFKKCQFLTQMTAGEAFPSKHRMQTSKLRMQTSKHSKVT